MYKTNDNNMEMDEAKKPAMILATVDLMGLIAATYYFYKANEELELKLAAQQKVIAGLLQRMNNLEKGNQHREGGFTKISEQIKALGETVEQLPSVEHLESIDDDITEIADALHENNINVELPSAMRNRMSNRRSSRDTRDTRDFEDRRSSMSRRTAVKSSRDTDVRARGYRAAVRPEQRDNRDQRVQPSRHYENDDDETLIGEVRRQQES